MAPHDDAMTNPRRFLIVTPAFNAEAFIDEAVASVLRQGLSGYALHYHVQDGGSTDGTLDKLHAWERRLRDGVALASSGDVHFSFASERDGGMYDALQRGFAGLAPRDDDILTWINSDDGLAQGSLVTVASVVSDLPGCEFLSGRITLLNEAGAVILLAPALPYARSAMADGRHDGRTLPFLMQEGTFFSGRVWNAVGGVDPTFRLAGDWDLWRRMARVAGHFSVDSVTGYHRRRRGQLSGDMEAYYREVDAAPALPPVTDFGSLGTVVTFDQATARWIEIAYDPAMETAPALLRDGRPERSAVCRPTAGFGAPEGPYPQYQLPGGIRWIDGANAEITMSVPAAGRYRVRLALRASRAGLVVGLAVGAREPQPITLEPPIPLVDQVIETVRWLDAGENCLRIDCNGAADARSVLLIRCEVTSTDEAFSRHPVVSPMLPGHCARPARAIAIICDDDEPDLLDLSLTGCEDMVLAGVAVFVVRDPDIAALQQVLHFRSALVAGCINIPGSQVDMAALRQGLHAAGHDEVLMVRRGSLVTPRGVDAASTLLDATGADAVHGFVDERDSMGRSLHLSAAMGMAPVLYRAKTIGVAPLRAGCALAQTVAKADDAASAPVVWIVDGDRPMLGRTPATLIAAGLALLGYDVRHVAVETGQTPVFQPDAFVIASHRGTDMPQATMTIEREGGRLRLARHHGETVDLPLVLDTDLLLPRDRDDARRRLGFAPDERIICIAEATADATMSARAAARALGAVRILDFGNASFSGETEPDVFAFGAIADPLLLSYLLSAADAALVLKSGGGPLACAAWACHLAVLDSSGRLLPPEGDPEMSAATGHPADPAEDRCRSRDLMVATRSLAALADAIAARFPDLSPVGGSSPLRLRGGTIRLRSYRNADRVGWFDQIVGCGTVTALGGDMSPSTPDRDRGFSIAGQRGEILVCLKRTGVARLRLHVQGTPGEVWDVRAGDGAATFRIGDDEIETVSVIGTFEPGPIRVRFDRQGDGVAGLRITGVSAVGGAMPSAPGWEETRFELAPANAWPTQTLEIDSDWQRATGFLPEEPPVPQEGLYVPFRWSGGTRCSIRIRVAVGGARTLRLALSAGVRHQRVRPVVAGQYYDWCMPLSGPIGHVEDRAWLVDWPVGDIDVSIEVDDVLHAPGQDLGIILFAVTLE